MTGARTFLRTFLRRDRWMILWFVLGTTVLYWSQAVSTNGLYADQAAFDRAAASMESNPAFIAMAGPARALDTLGGQVAWQASAFGAIVVGLMVMFLVGRHTRAEEESGRDELVRSGAVDRTAPMTAAVLVALLASIVTGLAVSLSLVSYGLPSTGSWSLGIGLALCGVAYTGVAVLAAQVTSSTRAMYGLVGTVIGASYALRAIGDVSGGDPVVALPHRLVPGDARVLGDRWWPGLLLLLLGLVTGAAAYAVFDRRDFGSGVLATRPGPARAGADLHGHLGLAWRLQRGSLAGWTVGLFLGGLGYGSIGDDIGSLVGDSEFSQDVFGSAGPDLVDSFYAVAIVMLVLIGAGFTIASALRPHGEEEGGRVETLLATALRRWHWLVGHLAVTVAGTVVVVGAAGLGLGAGYALVTGDGGALLPLAGDTMTMVPGALLLGTLGTLLTGLFPRWAALAWLGLGFCAVVLMFGTALGLPEWLLDLSPFTHLAAVPAEPMDWSAFAGVLAVAVGIGVVGIVGFTRRDVR